MSRDQFWTLLILCQNSAQIYSLRTFVPVAPKHSIYLARVANKRHLAYASFMLFEVVVDAIFCMILTTLLYHVSVQSFL